MAAVLKSDGPRLQLNLVPATVTIYSMRLCLERDEMAGVIAKALNRTGSICVTCGSRATTVDDVFTYVGTTQRFEGFIAVCAKCEATRRVRFSQIAIMELMNHLGSANQHGLMQTRRYMQECVRIWETRSAVAYPTVDISKLIRWVPPHAIPQSFDHCHPAEWAGMADIEALRSFLRRPHAQ